MKKNIKTRLISLAGLLLCTITAPVSAETGNANDNRECATCHVMWLADFQDKTVETLIPYDPQPMEKSGRGPDVASTDLMCFSCHDGYVLESRYRWREHRHNHPVGQKVSDKVKIPRKDGKDVFPLNLDNKIYCGTCHSAHGIDWAQNKSAIFMRAVNNNSNMCRACHEDHGTGPQHGNHPIMLDIKRLPEQLVEAGAKIGPNNNMICETCHRQHGAPGDKLLAIDNADTSELCLTCHKTRNSLRNSKHDMSVVAPEFRNSKNQSPQKNGPCSACHVSHGAKGPRLAAIPADKNADPLEANCTNCHSSTGVANKATTGVHSHPVNVDIRKLDIKVDETGWQSTSVLAPTQPLQALPLYDKNGQRTDKATQVACSTCHDPHVWAKTDNDKQPVSADVKGDSNTSFLRIPQGKQSNLCLNCHAKERAAEFSKHNAAVHDTAIAEKMRTTKDKLAEGLCETCHKTHNGYGPMMWARNEGLGQAPIERLCNDCHNKEGVAKEKLTGTYSHPMQVEQKAVKAHDKLPMFDEQGKHNPAGMIDCGTCHNVHQWDPANAKNENGSKKDSEGDALNSFLRIPVNAEAALCVTCHSEHQFVVGTDHDLNVSAPTAQNKLGKNVKQTGVCGQCHVAHKAKTKTNLWARNLAVENESADFFCRSCHIKDGPAAKKEIPTDRLSHPKNVSVWSGAVRSRGDTKTADKFTVFNSMGNASHAGEIACPSCHNPHRWNPREKQKGPAVNIEGDANNSFLKMTNSENFVCADCHGLDALFRYQYFHAPSSRVKHSLFN